MFVIALVVAIGAQTALGLEKLSADDKANFLVHVQKHSVVTHSRRLLSGYSCISYISETANAYFGECGTLKKKDERHWCSGVDFFDSDYDDNNFPLEICIAESENECCTINGGAVAGIVIGIIVFIVGVVILCLFLCKCCCFRKKSAVTQNVQQAQPQVIYVTTPSPSAV